MMTLSRGMRRLTGVAGLLGLVSYASSQGLYTTRDDTLFRFDPGDRRLIEVGPIGLPGFQFQSITFMRQVGLLALGLLPNGDTILAKVSPFDGSGTILASLGNGPSQGTFSGIENSPYGLHACHASPDFPDVKRYVGLLTLGGPWYEQRDTRRDNDFMVWNPNRSLLITWDPDGEARFRGLSLMDGHSEDFGVAPSDLSDGAYDGRQRISYILSTQSLRLYSMSFVGNVATIRIEGDLSGSGTARGLAWIPSLDRVFGTAKVEGQFYGQVRGNLEVQVWQRGELVETLSGNYGVDYRFAFSPTVSGDVVLKFRFHTCLWKELRVTLGEAPIENLTITMTNGDCDHDNEVGIGDYAIISSTYGLPWWAEDFDTNADLNGDEYISLSDYAILAANYGAVGD